jgi:signal transduction histidine kinase
MTFRTKLLLITSLTVTGSVALATGAISLWTRLTFERMDLDRRQTALRQFEKDLSTRGQEVAARVQKAASSETALRVAIEANRPSPDLSLLLNDARTLAETQSLDFLDLVQPDLSILSSAHWPARFGYKNDWAGAESGRTSPDPFLTRVPTQEGSAAALAAIRTVSAGEKKIFVLGAERLNPSFLASIGASPGTRAVLWLSAQEVFDASGPLAHGDRLAQLAAEVERTSKPANATIQWEASNESAEALQAMPFLSGGKVVGVLFIGTSLREQIRLQRSILWTGLLVGASGILLGLLTGLWTTERVTRPVKLLAAGAKAVAGGDLNAQVTITPGDEIGDLAESFNAMTVQLSEQRARAIQAERVAAWRELARRLAHELKNPLFPLQITVENLRKARAQHPQQFEEVFEQCTSTLLAELGNLRGIVDRFSDFAKMPQPTKGPAELNEVVRGVVRLFEAQFAARTTAPIELALHLSPEPLPVQLDQEQMGRALKNLVLNAMDAMPAGGTLRIRTAQAGDSVSLEVADSGQGLTQEECERLFTPYYTTKRHGTGLGLAIVQSVVSDHQGKISVTSEPGKGACFLITLPAGRVE